MWVVAQHERFVSRQPHYKNEPRLRIQRRVGLCVQINLNAQETTGVITYEGDRMYRCTRPNLAEKPNRCKGCDVKFSAKFRKETPL